MATQVESKVREGEGDWEGVKETRGKHVRCAG